MLQNRTPFLRVKAHLQVIIETEVFHTSSGGAEAMASKMSVPYLGKIPLDPSLSRSLSLTARLPAFQATTEALQV